MGEDRAGVSQVISVSNRCTGAAISDIGVDNDDNPSGGGGFETGPWGAGGTESTFNPCDQLKKIEKEPEFKTKMEILKSNIETGTKEKGFVLFDEPVNSNYLPPKFKTSDIIEGDTNGDINYASYFAALSNDQQYRRYGAAHNHLKSNPKHIGVFSPEDLANLILFGWIESASTNPYGSLHPEKSVNFVITNIGLFAIKINDLSKLEAFMNKYGEMNLNNVLDKYIKDEIEEKYKITPTSSHDEQVTGFLRLINDEDIGIDLYEGNSENYNNWKKLNLVNNGNQTFAYNEVPCDL